MDKIPMVDFSAMSSLKETPEDCLSAEIKLLAEEIHQAFSTVGFVYIKNHGISQAKVTASLFSTRILPMIWHIMSRGLFPIPGRGENSRIKRTGIAGFHTVRAWVQSVYYGINNTRSIYSERAHRALQNP